MVEDVAVLRKTRAGGNWLIGGMMCDLVEDQMVELK
jgi:hypothetical protein